MAPDPEHRSSGQNFLRVCVVKERASNSYGRFGEHAKAVMDTESSDWNLPHEKHPGLLDRGVYPNGYVRSAFVVGDHHVYSPAQLVRPSGQAVVTGVFPSPPGTILHFSSRVVC